MVMAKTKSKILVVDDDIHNLQLMADCLSDYDVATATSGREAIRLVDEWEPDIILMDVCMPEMDGIKTCRHIKKIPDRCHIPVVFLTVMSDVNYKLQAYLAGGVDYLTKPVDLDEVLERLRVRLRKLERAREKRKSDSGRSFELASDGAAPCPNSVSDKYFSKI